jgi:uncharacterized protein
MTRLIAKFAGCAVFASAIAAPATVLILAPAAQAQGSAKAVVDAAKASGEVGEQADGYLGVVVDASPATRAALSEINAGRAGAYRDAAAKAGVTPAAAGEAAYRQLLSRMPPGQYYKPAGGGWTRK